MFDGSSRGLGGWQRHKWGWRAREGENPPLALQPPEFPAYPHPAGAPWGHRGQSFGQFGLWELLLWPKTLVCLVGALPKG